MPIFDVFRRLSGYCLVGSFFAFPVSVALVNSLMFLAVLLWVISLQPSTVPGLVRRAWSNPVVKPALALVVVVVLASLWSPADWAAIFGYYKKYVKFLLLPVFICMLLDSRIRRHCWRAFAVAMLFTLVSTWLNVWTDLPWSVTRNRGFGVDHTVFKDHIAQGIMMSFFVLLTAHWAVRATDRVRRYVWWSVCLLAAVSILFLSQGRTGYLSLLFSFLAFVLTTIKWHVKGVLSTVVLAGGVMSLVFAMSPQFQARTMLAWHEAQTSSVYSVTSVGARIQVWRFIAGSSTKSTVFGSGTGAYPVLSQTHFTDTKVCAVVCPHPHNQFLLFFFELGLVGLMLFFWYFFVIIRQALRHEDTHRALMLGFAVVMFVSNMTHSSMWLSTESHFFILMAALLMASARPREPEHGVLPTQTAHQMAR